LASCADRLLEAGDELHGVLDLVLGMLAERPVRQVEAAAEPVHADVELHQEFVGGVAGEGEPLVGHHHRVEFVAMEDEQAATVGGGVDRAVADLTPPKFMPANCRNISS
jgi:hypothetical protein